MTLIFSDFRYNLLLILDIFIKVENCATPWPEFTDTVTAAVLPFIHDAFALPDLITYFLLRYD